MKKLLTICAITAVLFASTSVFATMTGFIVSTDRVSYTGTITRYDTLADAQTGQNAVGGPYAIPARDTAEPYNTGYRDAGLWFVDNYTGYGNANIFLTAWYYTTNQTKERYSGWGNPNNTNTGFIQLYDDNGNSDTSVSGGFQNKVGSYWTEFHLQAAGQNATYDPCVSPNDWARLWPAPVVGGAGVITTGEFISYEIDIVFGGLEGIESIADVIEATNHPTSVTGTFTTIFENKNATYYPEHANKDPSLEGFYKVEFTFGLDNWAYGQGENLVGGPIDDSFFATIPEPATIALLGLGALGLVRRKRS